MYLIGNMLILLIFLLGLVFGIGLPVLAGVLVYHDASKRIDCSPWLWALVAAFAPCFIGVIVYLVIRRDYPLKDSPAYRAQSMQQESETDGSFAYQNDAPAQKGLPTWVKALIVIVCVIVAICLITLVVSVIKAIAGAGVMYDSYHYGF